jgi:hypothetical protein
MKQVQKQRDIERRHPECQFIYLGVKGGDLMLINQIDHIIY